MVSLSMKPVPDSLTVGGRKWLRRIHISEHLGLTNQNAKIMNKLENKNWLKERDDE